MKVIAKEYLILLLVFYGTQLLSQSGNWILQSPIMGNQDISYIDVSTIGPDKVWITGYVPGATSNPEHFLVHSGDGGSSWTTQLSDISYRFRGMDFIDESTGWVVGENGLILKTDDGGVTWIPQMYETRGEDYLLCVTFVNDSTGWIVGYYEYGEDAAFAIILHTLDGGEHWNHYDGQIGGGLGSASFINENTGWAVGQSGILSTSDGGDSWNSQNTQLDGFYAVWARDSLNIWTFLWREDMNCLTSSDGGNTWNEISGFNGAIYDAHFFGETGWIVGTSIWETEDGGVTWDEIEDIHLWAVDFSTIDIGWGIAGRDAYKYSTLTSNVANSPSIYPNSNNFIVNTYPNPFNSSIRIIYKGNQNSKMHMEIFDINGNQIRQIVPNEVKVGTCETYWDGKDEGMEDVPAGIYFIQLVTGETFESQKILYLK